MNLPQLVQGFAVCRVQGFTPDSGKQFSNLQVNIPYGRPVMVGCGLA
ncbi:hypothetical protein CKO_02860 [Citrobacter koseri ATCC BAA-895]|uniref:Uncharacterized protein n=1 Tax=Citrobacter koseri (strain ATCC BAA-895 / CDC 4225-83 / SGSC4696) TaxID=290338 RepID=A8AKF4_CITK8|nr:hypothetical protein CKO_02860 [Citrobacter koseri ATCC BAA-895]